ncbi:MAG: hypothetical protein E6R09_07335 [Rhodocyclaceae bacterium]|jgi:hypothetical protein|nr:MAG: hypothetical protein E6R09_07335 [Rhodocyclaceae bacterium]
MSAAKIINTLWQATDETKLSAEQLRSLCQSEQLALDLKNLALIMDRLAVLNIDDKDGGFLHDREDVSAALWGFSSVIEVLASAVHISGDAAGVLALRADGYL